MLFFIIPDGLIPGENCLRVLDKQGLRGVSSIERSRVHPECARGDGVHAEAAKLGLALEVTTRFGLCFLQKMRRKYFLKQIRNSKNTKEQLVETLVLANASFAKLTKQKRIRRGCIKKRYNFVSWKYFWNNYVVYQALGQPLCHSRHYVAHCL